MINVLNFYRKTLILLILLTLLSLSLGVYLVKKAYLSQPLLDTHSSLFKWRPMLVPQIDTPATWLHVRQQDAEVSYDFSVSSQEEFPYTAYNFDFYRGQNPNHTVDIRRYQAVQFQIKCAPANILVFVLFSHDEHVTQPDEDPTRRVSSNFFACESNWTTINIAFSTLDTPDWWLGRFDRELTDRAFNLRQVYAFGIVNSPQSPREILSTVHLKNLELRGYEPRYLYVGGVVGLLLWGAFILWVLRSYTRVLMTQLNDKLHQDRPFVAYQALRMSPQKDKEKEAVMRYLATEYANPNLSLEMISDTLGVNRSKINAILKSELDLTFSTYLNKLRLVEAARLLSAEEEANVAEIAYAVGYSNVSYFNKLFKSYYDCTPSRFKSYRKHQDSGAVTNTDSLPSK